MTSSQPGTEGFIPHPPSPTPNSLSHLDAAGRARMADVSGKDITRREAVARGRVTMQPATLQLILAGEGA